jgi:hypothetical protein
MDPPGWCGKKKPLVVLGEGLAAFVDSSVYAAAPRRPVRRTTRTRTMRTRSTFDTLQGA